MKKHLPIYLYGIIIIFVGFFLLFFHDFTFYEIKITLGISLILGAILAFISAFSRIRKQVQFHYHEMHALAMLVYGISILLFSNSFENLISFTIFLFIFYAVSEIIFCNWLFNLPEKIDYRIIAIRAFLALIVGIGTIIAMNYSVFTVQIFGVLFIMIGLNIMFYVPVMKNALFNEIN